MSREYKKTSKSSKFSRYDNSLNKLAKEITQALKENKDGSSQQHQVELLMSLEQQFRKTAIGYLQSREIYKKFILLVVSKNKNILSARPYFREKSAVFGSSITPAIKDANIQQLQTFHINFNLINFIMSNWLGDVPVELSEIFEKLVAARKKLIENNMPLVVNRAKIFFRKVPESHLTLMDMIGIASMGLVSGVDKWAGEYSKVFNGVCIGRMVGNLISNYSETTVHFYPSDSSVLYRANSLKFKKDPKDLQELANEINKSYEEDRKNGVKVPNKVIDQQELHNLFSAANPLSFDGDDGLEDGRYFDPEDEIVKKDLKSKMIESINKLANLERKIVVLKGVKG